MKYSFLFNQLGIVESGLADTTDFNDWAILEYVASWQNHSKALRDGSHVWLDYRHLLKEMPMLSVKTKSSLSNRIKKLKERGLLSTFLNEDRRCFVRVTDFYLSVVDFRPGDIERGVPENEQGVPENEQGVPENEQGVPENEQGVPENEQVLNNKVLNNKNNTLLLGKSFPQERKENENEPDDLVFSEPLQWAQFFIHACQFPRHIVQTSKTIPMFAQWVADKVPLGDMRLAMLACHSWNGERIPDSPLLYKKFLVSVQDEKRRLAEEGVFNQRSGSGRAKTEDWAKVPKVDDELERWAVKHGYPKAGRTMTYFQYRGFLFDKVKERKASEVKDD